MATDPFDIAVSSEEAARIHHLELEAADRRRRLALMIVAMGALCIAVILAAVIWA